LEIAKNKADVKDKNYRHFEIIAGNSMYADKFYKKNFFDLIVGDLPYGVRHGNVTNEKQSSLTRNPSELLAACLPAWKTVLKRGGVLVLSWNTFVFPRDKFTVLLEDMGFDVFSEGAYLDFVHRVDQSIKRDIIVAKNV
jgi:tRNA G10  N-methylase Trm11